MRTSFTDLRAMRSVLILAMLMAMHASIIAQDIQMGHCNCVTGGVPEDSTFTFRGRMSAWNGNPTFRIWRVGTDRILGLRGICVDSLILGELNPYMGLELWADFTVSAVTPQQPGVMQFVCIRSIKVPFLREKPN